MFFHIKKDTPPPGCIEKHLFFIRKKHFFIYKTFVFVLNKKTHFSIHPGGGGGGGGCFFFKKCVFFCCFFVCFLLFCIAYWFLVHNRLLLAPLKEEHGGSVAWSHRLPQSALSCRSCKSHRHSHGSSGIVC